MRILVIVYVILSMTFAMQAGHAPSNAHDPVDSVAVQKEMEIAMLQHEQLEKEVKYYRALIAVVTLSAIAIIIFSYYAMISRRRLQALKQERLLSDAQKYISGLENERKRVAKELHDGVANDLLGLEIKLSACEDTKHSWIAKEIAKIRNGVRDISHELIPPEFCKLGLDEVFAYYLNDLKSKGGVKIVYNTDGSLAFGAVSEHVALEVYRIVQELLSNILRHSQATRVTIEAKALKSSSMVSITISDDGPEWTYDTTTRGVGAITTSDRAVSIGAKVEYKRINNLNVKCITFNKHYGC